MNDIAGSVRLHAQLLSDQQLRRLEGRLGQLGADDRLAVVELAHSVAFQVAESLLAGQLYPATPVINYLFQAVIEATEEAILNSMFAAETMVGRDGHVRHALPIEQTMEIMGRHGRRATPNG